MSETCKGKKKSEVGLQTHPAVSVQNKWYLGGCVHLF